MLAAVKRASVVAFLTGIVTITIWVGARLRVRLEISAIPPYRRHRLSAGCHPARRLALTALHAQLPRRGELLAERGLDISDETEAGLEKQKAGLVNW